MTKQPSVKICKAALDELDDGTIVLRGVVEPRSLSTLLVDDYQREVRPLTSLQKLVEAFASGSRIPDIELGMRGQKFSEREGCFYLKDPVYIIDGQQRVSAAKHGMLTGELTSAHLGCVVHFDTTKEWERERFRILNTLRSKVSPNVLIRNMKDDSPVVEMLFNLCNDRSFPLKGKVCWTQSKRRQDVLTARTLLGTLGRLHSHVGPGRASGNVEMVRGLDAIMEKVGRQTLRDNAKVFFDLLDGAWGIRNIAFSEGTVHTKQMFLYSLANVISDHLNFWDSEKLTIRAADGRKIGSFPIADPTVRQLSGGASTSGDMLYELLKRHFDSGKRTHKLKPRVARLHTETDQPETDDDDESEVA